MSTLITEECINCGACEPECPNTAIYEGGAQWELDGATKPAIKEDIYYIVPDKCTECVGFFDQEQCAAVCPVDCCIPDPNIPETEEALIERARGCIRNKLSAPNFRRDLKRADAKEAPNFDHKRTRPDRSRGRQAGRSASRHSVRSARPSLPASRR